MNFKLKDIIIIAVVMLVSFPVLYTALLLATGTAKVVFVSEKKEDTVEKAKIALMNHSARKDSIAAANSKTFQALQKERADIAEQRARMADQQQRLEILQKELETQRSELLQERQKFEKLVSQSDSLDMKKMKELAKVYGAMKPAEAAQILETMPDATTAKIIRMINDDRQKAKILSLLPASKAAGVSNIIGNISSKH